MTLTHPTRVLLDECDRVTVELDDGRRFMAQQIIKANRPVFVVQYQVPNLRFLDDHHFRGREVTQDRRFCLILRNGLSAAELQVGDALTLLMPDGKSSEEIGRITRLDVETPRPAAR